MIVGLFPKFAICNSTEPFLLRNDKGLVIRGMVTEKNIAIPCRIRLYEKLSGRLIAEVPTNEQGNYEFNHLSNAKFFIVAHHPTSKFNAVIQDNVVPK